MVWCEYDEILVREWEHPRQRLAGLGIATEWHPRRSVGRVAGQGDLQSSIAGDRNGEKDELNTPLPLEIRRAVCTETLVCVLFCFRTCRCSLALLRRGQEVCSPDDCQN